MVGPQTAFTRSNDENPTMQPRRRPQLSKIAHFFAPMRGRTGLAVYWPLNHHPSPENLRSPP
jgi:AraC family transcriptional regulator